MPARKASQGLKGHPMEQKIIEALMDGQSDREIAEWVRPRVTHVTVWRYRTTVLKPTMANAEKLKSVLPHNMLDSNGFSDAVTASNTALQDDLEVKRLAKQAILAAPAIHIRENRLKLNQEITSRLMTVINERSTDMSVCESCRKPESAHPWEEMRAGKDADGMPIEFRVGCDVYNNVPGGRTGLVVRKLKATGTEYAVDVGLLAEIREHEKHVAIELGQWQEGQTSNVSIQIVCPSNGASPDQMPRITFAHQDALEAAPIDDDEGMSDLSVIQKPE